MNGNEVGGTIDDEGNIVPEPTEPYIPYYPPVIPDPVDPPVVIDEPEAPLAEEPVVEIVEEEVPLVELPDEDVPLADVPKTGDLHGLWLSLSGTGLAGLALLKKKDEE